MIPPSNNALAKLLLVGLCSLTPLSVAQQPPNTTLSQVIPFATNSSGQFRQNLCDEYRAVWEGRTELPDALDGVHINVMFALSEYDNFQDGRLDASYPGLVPTILDEVCLRAGCTWRNTYTMIPALPDDKTWTDLLLWMIDTYDLSANWWASSISRLKAGATFPEPWYDGSIIMVAKSDPGDDSGFSAWGWLDPFDSYVWLTILCTIAFSAAVFCLLERLDPHSDGDGTILGPVESAWMFATAFTGQFEFDPKTSAARLFTFSISMWALLMSAAYTANLASFLVVKNSPKLAFQSLDEAVKQNVPMCIRRSSGADAAVSLVYPNANLIRTDTAGIFEGVQTGRCAVAITTVSGWENYKYNEAINGECSMQWIGRVFLHVPASFGVKADSGEKCTSLLRDVINVHLMQMIEDGFLESAWKQHTQQTATVFCDGTEASEEEEFSDTSKLTLANMGGVFLLHAIFSAASILLAVGVWIYQGRTKKTAALGVIGEEDASMNGIFKDANESENCIDAEEKSPHTPAKHSSLLLSGSVGRDFEVENLRIEMNRKLDKLLKMMEDEKKNA